MGVYYRFINIEELDFLRNMRFYQHTSPKENKAIESPTTVVDIYNSSKQILIEPGVIDTLGNALLHLATNMSTSAVPEEEQALALTMMDNMNVSVDDSYLDAETDFRYSLLLTVLLCTAYIVVFIIGFLGNLLTVAVVYRLPRMRNVTNYFIVSLAVADILVLILCLPGTLMSNIFVREYILILCLNLCKRNFLLSHLL
ncbi:hypothetical protein PGB90_002540 [Kerria lacca]